MGTWVHDVVIVIYALITFHGDHVVKSKQFGDGQINQCHDRNGDCSTERTKSNVLLRLPRLDAVKVMNFFLFVFYRKRELYIPTQMVSLEKYVTQCVLTLLLSACLLLFSLH